MRVAPIQSSCSFSRTRTLFALAGPALALALCGSGNAGQADTDAARAAQAAAEKAMVEKAMAEKAMAEQADAEQRAWVDQAQARARSQARELRPTAVVPVAGNPGEFAEAINKAFQGAVEATFMGNSLVLTGDKQSLASAQDLIEQLNRTYAMNQERAHVEALRQQELDLARQAERTPIDNRVFDVTFGPTLGESLAAIAKAVGTDNRVGLNIVYTSDESLANLPVRAVQLQRVTVRSAMSTLENIVSTGGRNDSVVELWINRTNASGESPVVTVSPRAPRGARTGPPEYRVAVFRLQGLSPEENDEMKAQTSRQHAETLQAIEIGLEIVGRSPDFKIKLHPESGMLFAKGTRDELRIVAEVLDLPIPFAAEGQPAPIPAPNLAPTPGQTPAPTQSPSAAGASRR